MCATEVVLTSSLTLRSHLCFVMIVNCGKAHTLFSKLLEVILSFVLSLISLII